MANDKTVLFWPKQKHLMAGIKSVWKTLGPGFLYAGAAVGVSHLVQSTKAGAEYGFTLLAVVVVSNILKYPFFETGPRYASATGENLIQGYAKIGKWAVYLFTALTASTAFIIQAAVTIVSAALFANLLGIEFSAVEASAILLLVCATILFFGQYKWLDSIIKWIVILLSIASIIAFFRAQSLESEISLWPTWITTSKSFVFLFALMGWMPAPLDISAWHSIWTVEKQRGSNNKLQIKEALRDFHIGYWGTAVLALIFLSLGALVLFARSDGMANLGGAAFSQKFVSMYTETLGQWTYPIIAFAAFATMFSTTITVLDGAPRVADSIVPIIKNQPNTNSKKVYRISIIVIALGALLIIWLFAGKDVFLSLIKMATITSFLTAPVIAFLNYRLSNSEHMPDSAKPGKLNKAVSIIGLLFLFAFAIIYLLFLLDIITFNY